MDRSKTSHPAGATLDRQYAVLNLDFMYALTKGLRTSTEGRSFLLSCKRWVDAVHAKTPQPLVIYTTLYFHNDTRPELASGSPFSRLIEKLEPLAKSCPGAQIGPDLTPTGRDILLQKTRLYAGSGNALDQILRAQNIKAVILVGGHAAG